VVGGLTSTIFRDGSAPWSIAEVRRADLSRLPAAAIDAFGYEVRLDDTAHQPDLSIHVRSGRLGSVTEWAKLQSTIYPSQRWLALWGMLEPLSRRATPADVWLEFDGGDSVEAPSVFCSVQQPADNRSILQHFAAVLHIEGTSAQDLDVSLDVAATMGAVSNIAVMLGRPRADFRFCVDLPVDIDSVERLPSTGSPAHSRLEQIAPYVDSWTLQLSAPDLLCLGLECFVNRGDTSKWQCLLQALDPHCAIDQSAAKWAASFGGARRMRCPDRLWLTTVLYHTRHIKVPLDPLPRAGAKVYVGVIHR
jgi:hypothetical protein